MFTYTLTANQEQMIAKAKVHAEIKLHAARKRSAKLLRDVADRVDVAEKKWRNA